MNVFATLIFASAMATAMILTVAVRGVAARVGLTDRPDGRRKLHGKPIPLGGGLAVFAANVAEGFNRSQRKYLSSLDIALGEAAEAENWLYKVRNANFLDPDTAAARIRESIEIQKMLHGLVRSISKHSNT
ncbi:MAG: four helix bundle protein [Thermoguttaceae bacterium]